jgi:hypothetical protein
MIKKTLLEMTRLEAAKETDNKLRWDVEVEGTRFSLYIPKWRVPQPWPARILVDLVLHRGNFVDEANLSENDVAQDATLRHEPIIATITKLTKHTTTIRYSPSGDPKKWEIGEPYVPFPMTYGEADRLRIIVLWDIYSRGEFHSQDANTLHK